MYHCISRLLRSSVKLYAFSLELAQAERPNPAFEGTPV